jgi:cytochrome c oxidase subunit IV
MNTHLVPLRGYVLTWLALLGLTVLTVLVGFANLGQFSILIAVGIAAVQAALIAAFYMHALFGPRLVRVIVATGIVWFVFLAQTLGDYITRGWVPFPGK